MKSLVPLALPATDVLENLFDNLPVGVVGMDAESRVVVFNRHEEQLAGRLRERVLGRRFFDEVAPCMNVRQLAGAFFDGVKQGALNAELEFSFPFPTVKQPRDVVVRMKSFHVEGRPHGLLLVEDVSMQRSVERLKETLATLLVHDLKSPLASVLANVDFVRLKTEGHPNPDVLAALDDAKAGATRLGRMIHDLLDVTRLETGTFPLDRRRVDTADVLRSAVRRAEANARVYRVRIAAGPCAGGEAMLDEPAVQRILDNLLDNAVRYTPKGQEIRVDVVEEGDDVVFVIENDGPAIPAELRERIFEKFVQVDADRHRRAGTNQGLGLTFVRMAARAHGGDVTVSAGAGDQGTTFRVRLPREA